MLSAELMHIQDYQQANEYLYLLKLTMTKVLGEGSFFFFKKVLVEINYKVFY